jgi:hypothetical protein
VRQRRRHVVVKHRQTHKNTRIYFSFIRLFFVTDPRGKGRVGPKTIQIFGNFKRDGGGG